MTSDSWSIFGLVAVLLPTLYFLIASPAFLLARFEDPVVSNLFRDLLSFHFKLIAIGSTIATIAFAIAGRPAFAAALASIGLLAVTVRLRFLGHLDGHVIARNAGDPSAVQRLRQLHRRAMAYNATQLIALLAMIPFVFAGNG